MAKKEDAKVREDARGSEPSSALLRASSYIGKKNGNSSRPPISIDQPAGAEHRQFPRASMAVRFNLWIGEGDDRRFAATLKSDNVSVSGAFLESTFFLPVETEIRVSFALEEDGVPVEARAQIVREERPGQSGQGRSGFGIRFVEFYGQTEVTLAKLFLGEQLLEFAQRYLQSKRARSLTSELERVVDTLAAWELLKVTAPGNPWYAEAEQQKAHAEGGSRKRG